MPNPIGESRENVLVRDLAPGDLASNSSRSTSIRCNVETIEGTVKDLRTAFFCILHSM